MSSNDLLKINFFISLYFSLATRMKKEFEKLVNLKRVALQMVTVVLVERVLHLGSKINFHNCH